MMSRSTALSLLFSFLCAASFFLLSFSIASSASTSRQNIFLKGEKTQGGMMIGKASAKARVFIDGEEIMLSPEGYFVFGFGRNHRKNALLELHEGDKVWKHALDVKPRKYEVQRIDGIKDSFVRPPRKFHARILREGKTKKAALRSSLPDIFFTQSFRWPLRGIISGVYGSQRILNGVRKRPHYGVDIAAPEGTKVRAPAGGTIILAGDYYYEGGLIFLDHGHNLVSAFLHLETIKVKKGQKVSKGEVIATVGKSGRVTGAHLDWRISWRGRRLDPALLVGPMPSSE